MLLLYFLFMDDIARLSLPVSGIFRSRQIALVFQQSLLVILVY